MRQHSMDEMDGFEPTDTTGFIQIESIRIKKCVFYILKMLVCYLVLELERMPDNVYKHRR